MGLITENNNYIKINSATKSFLNGTVTIDFSCYDTEKDREKEKEREGKLPQFFVKLRNYRDQQYAELLNLFEPKLNLLKNSVNLEDFKKHCTLEEKQKIETFQILDNEISLVLMSQVIPVTQKLTNKETFAKLGFEEEWLTPISRPDKLTLNIGQCSDLELPELYTKLRERTPGSKNS